MRCLTVLTREGREFPSPCGIAPGWNTLFWGTTEGKHHDARSQSSTLSPEDTRDRYEVVGRSDRDHLPSGPLCDDVGAPPELLDPRVRAIAAPADRTTDGMDLKRRSLSPDPAEIPRPRKRRGIRGAAGLALHRT